MALADFIRVQKFLGGIHYPATKQQLVDHARGNQANDEALSTLGGMPEREYSGPDEVSRVDRGGLTLADDQGEQSADARQVGATAPVT